MRAKEFESVVNPALLTIATEETKKIEVVSDSIVTFYIL